MRASSVLRRLCLIGVLLFHAGCSGLIAGTSPDVDGATRENPDLDILVTVENQSAAM